MKSCVICSAKLDFFNTPTFGSGKLLDGGVVCTTCFKKIAKINQNIALKLKRHSYEEIKNLLGEKSTKLEEVKAQIQKLDLDNVSTFFGRKEINELPHILAQSETIDNLVQGTYNNRNGILVSTDRRLIFIDKGLIYGLKVEDFPIDKITSIQYETGIALGKIKIHTSGNVATIENIEKSSAKRFSEFVRDKLSPPKEIQSHDNSKTDVLDKIEKLANLKEKGVLTEEEFIEQKKKLLEKL